jgi:hypothetical protein
MRSRVRAKTGCPRPAAHGAAGQDQRKGTTVSKRTIAFAGLATTAVLAGSLGFAAPAAAGERHQDSASQQVRADRDRCPDTVIRTFAERENVLNAPGTFRRVVSVQILKQVEVDRDWNRRAQRCEFRGWNVEPVYRDTPRDGTDREHLVLVSRYRDADRRLGFPLPYWKHDRRG